VKKKKKEKEKQELKTYRNYIELKLDA